MTDLFKIIHNVETNEVEQVPLTAEEVAVWEADQQAVLAEVEAKAEAAAKRQALLDKLGITEDEAKLLLGGN